MSSAFELLRIHAPSPRFSARAVVLTLVLACTVLPATPATAALAPASVLDGPSAAILDVDGAAMAPDGSGGILYRKLVGGQPHLFVSRLVGGTWQPPIQVDTGQPFGASSPAIAAGNGGRLLVVWIEPWAVIDQSTKYQLMSAELSPGANTFAPAIQVDPHDVGDGSAAFPSLAMAPDGNAYVAYRVVTQSLSLGTPSSIVPLRPGDELIDVRVAHYNGDGLAWSSLGAINQFPQLTMRRPTALNAPKIGVSQLGDAVVTWQEPDLSGAARIWARRIFGNTLGNVLAVSQDSAGGQPIAADADAPALAVNYYGEAKIAYRIAGGPGSPYGTTRIFLNTLPPDTAPSGNRFNGPTMVDGGPALGPPSIAIEPSANGGAFRLAYADGGSTRVVSGDDSSGDGTPVGIGPDRGERALTAIEPAGGGVSAWPAASAAGLPVIDLREDLGTGAWQLAQLSAPIGGLADEPVLAGSGMGDALVGFRQGPPGEAELLGAIAKGPPGEFLVSAPSGWVRGGAARLSWEPAGEAFGATRYAVLVDGQIRQRGLTAQSTLLDSRGLGDGVHHVQVLAIDSDGQQTMSAAVDLKVDANPPVARLLRGPHGRVRVRVSDRASGAVARDTVIDFGDGTRVVGRLSAAHAYTHPGLYTITVHCGDRVGNRASIHLRVQVR
jgi:hypothetical protein